MTCNSVKKAASERLDWVTDYSDWLIEADTIATVETPIGSELLAEPIIEGDAIRIWLSGGNSGTSYKVPIKITTAQGRVRNEVIRVRIR